ncbi:uncharacterized protein [Anolis sagrei]|uniref:uncharacterized protein n=1 Tax=Anolis sagrei TaxID=38937 RepID=UPI0035209CB5
MNLPWSGLTTAHFCFNPPGAFYFGKEWLKYDYPVFLKELDTNSYEKWPTWLDGFKSCPHRVYYEYSTVIIHLSRRAASSVHVTENKNIQPRKRTANQKEDRLDNTPRSEAWTVLHVFSTGYCNTGIYQLPLFQGAPSKIMLASLSQGKCSSVMKSMLHKQVIQLVPGASVVVRIADGRWDAEFSYTSSDIDQLFLPKQALGLYNKEASGVKIAELMLQETSEKQVKCVAFLRKTTICRVDTF